MQEKQKEVKKENVNDKEVRIVKEKIQKAFNSAVEEKLREKAHGKVVYYAALSDEDYLRQHLHDTLEGLALHIVNNTTNTLTEKVLRLTRDELYGFSLSECKYSVWFESATVKFAESIYYDENKDEEDDMEQREDDIEQRKELHVYLKVLDYAKVCLTITLPNRRNIYIYTNLHCTVEYLEKTKFLQFQKIYNDLSARFSEFVSQEKAQRAQQKQQ